ncbi:aldo/keto reductase [Pseudomonas kermanshahensis]|uniref:Aldo/keto reductase n=1 Tax=Pseudomonas kermanshahensis TaxID=2745482 RepID=A0ABU8R0F8_9PSED
MRSIGVCNFQTEHLKALCAESSVIPAVNQVELHPFLVQNDLRRTHAQMGILTQAWSPIGGVNRYWNSGQDPLIHPVIIELAENHRRTAAQIILRWHLQRGVAVIPKSVRAERITENADIFDFSLTESEIDAIAALDQNKRGGPDPATR